MGKEKISDNVIRRLPRYIRYLDSLIEMGNERVSSAEISRALNLTASQVRQDLNCFGAFGQPGYGYNTVWLRNEIARILSSDDKRTAVIVGVGNLGRALMRNFRFEDCGVQLTAGFDVDPALVGTELSGVPILSIERLGDYIKANKTDVVVLTLPADLADKVQEIAASSGAGGIWNFTNRELSPVSGLIVENVHFSDSLFALGYYLQQRK